MLLSRRYRVIHAANRLAAEAAVAAVTARNDMWSMDFVADERSDARRFRTLTVTRTQSPPTVLAAVGWLRQPVADRWLPGMH
jgi:hypothetical protein